MSRRSRHLRVVQPGHGGVDDLFRCKPLRATLRQRVCIERQFALNSNFRAIHGRFPVCVACPFGRVVAAAFPDVVAGRERPVDNLTGWARLDANPILSDPAPEEYFTDDSVGARCESDLYVRDPFGDRARMRELTARMQEADYTAKHYGSVRRPNSDRDRALRMRESGNTYAEIGLALGCSRARAWDYVATARKEANGGVAPPPEVRGVDRELVMHLYAEGLQSRLIGERLGICQSQVNRIILEQKALAGHRVSLAPRRDRGALLTDRRASIG